MKRSATQNSAFTLLEMLAVIVVIVLLAIITIPAFAAMLASGQRVQAEESLKRAMALGQSLAMRAANGRDVAMVFFYEPPGPITIVACQKVAEFQDVDGRTGLPVRREVFVPIGGAEPVSIPGGWSVRGYALPSMIDAEWYEPATGRDGAPRYTASEPAWVFPETGFYDVNLGGAGGDRPDGDGYNRQSFMVRFEGTTGRQVNWPLRAAIVLSARPSARLRVVAQDWQRIDLSQDIERWVHRVTATTDLTGDQTVDAADVAALQDLIGDESADTILVKPVSALALYEERKLAAALGASLDRRTGCLYMYNGSPAAIPPPDPYRPSFPQFVPGTSVTDIRINQWIEGDTNGDGIALNPVDDQPSARIFTVDRFTGQVRAIMLEPGSAGGTQ